MRTNRTAAVLSCLGALALTAALFTSPAGATDRDGDADRDEKTSYTEDDDTNDGGTANNVEDDGDNRHPSGRDRSVESGGSDTQGRSESDPDDDGRGPDRSNGGPDKANGSGGVDLADQDGNNGCGNDDDFEDDNEGWCGNKPEKPESETDAAGSSSCVKGDMPADRCDHKDECVEAGGMTDGDDAKTCDHDDECVDAGGMTDGDDAKTCDHDDECVDADSMTDGNSSTSDDDDCALSIADKGEVLALEAMAAVTSGGGASAVVIGADDAAALGAMLEAPADDTDSGVLSSVSAGALAFTGDHIMLMVIVAMLALVAGTVLVRQTRRGRIEA